MLFLLMNYLLAVDGRRREILNCRISTGLTGLGAEEFGLVARLHRRICRADRSKEGAAAVEALLGIWHITSVVPSGPTTKRCDSLEGWRGPGRGRAEVRGVYGMGGTDICGWTCSSLDRLWFRRVIHQ